MGQEGGGLPLIRPSCNPQGELTFLKPSERSVPFGGEVATANFGEELRCSLTRSNPGASPAGNKAADGEGFVSLWKAVCVSGEVLGVGGRAAWWCRWGRRRGPASCTKGLSGTAVPCFMKFLISLFCCLHDATSIAAFQVAYSRTRHQVGIGGGNRVAVWHVWGNQ